MTNWAKIFPTGFFFLLATNCRCLNMSWNAIEKGGANAIAEALLQNDTLQLLDISENDITTGSVALSRSLASCSLVSLNLCKNSIADAGGCAIAHALRVNSTLQYLDVSSNGLGADSGRGFAEALACNKCLNSLDLSSNELTDAGCRAIGEALVLNSCLQTLNLSCVGLGHNGCLALRQALCVNVTLTSLSLSYNGLGDEQASIICEILARNSCLQNLNLSSNYLRSASFQIMCEALEANSTLTCLDLYNNEPGHAGGQALGRLLSRNVALQHINLAYNDISAESAVSISRGLCAHPALTTLNMSWNALGDAGGRALARALAHNTCLRVLDASNNHLGGDAVCEIARALENNTTLRTLKISQNQIGSRISALCMDRFDGMNNRAAGESLGDLSSSDDDDDDDDDEARAMKRRHACRAHNSSRSIEHSVTVALSRNLNRAQSAGHAIAHMLQTNRGLHTLDIYDEDFPICNQGVRAIGRALLESARCHELTVKGVDLTYMAHTYLDVPFTISCSSNDEVMEYFREAHRQKVLAFAMGLHPRLGHGCPVQTLSEDTLPVVFGAYYGVCGDVFVRWMVS
jgi:Ran GTPase-activating protein (RanGAP) involved in mRNA processing and transport